jgi:hypothetical protein
MSSSSKRTAEIGFREAFERLKTNQPTVLAKGAFVSQNNVAREAGRDPSALKKDRYPLLVSEIQAFSATLREQRAEKKIPHDNRTRSLKRRLADSRKQVSRLSSIVASQQQLIVDLYDEIERLEEGKVITVNTVR